MSAISLTGVWKGSYSYPRKLAPVDFVATLIETGRYLTGTTHEPGDSVGVVGNTAFAIVDGTRDGSEVEFVKSYENTPRNHSVTYIGLLNNDATEIRGRWMILDGWSGDFMMVRSPGKAAARLRRARASV